MSPEQQQALQQHVQEIAKILYQSSNPKDIETLEGIEKTIRAQTLEHISPQLGVFFSNKGQGQQQGDVEP
jgi:hypothetical protein